MQITDLDCVIERAIETCLVQNIADPVEILRYVQSKVLTGRQLDIDENSVSDIEHVEGDTNFILVNRNKVLETSFEEISEIKTEDLRKTLEVLFNGEISMPCNALEICLHVQHLH